MVCMSAITPYPRIKYGVMIWISTLSEYGLEITNLDIMIEWSSTNWILHSKYIQQIKLSTQKIIYRDNSHQFQVIVYFLSFLLKSTLQLLLASEQVVKVNQL